MKPKRPTGFRLLGYKASEDYCVPDSHGYCATCADEALPARVLEVDEEQWTAVVEMSGEPAEVDISLVDGVAVGQVVLVHGGVAIGSLSQEGLG